MRPQGTACIQPVSRSAEQTGEKVTLSKRRAESQLRIQEQATFAGTTATHGSVLGIPSPNFRQLRDRIRPNL